MGDNTKGIISLICGIIGLFCFGIVFGIIAIILGAMGRKSDESPTIATIGLILGIIDVICSIIGLLFFAAIMTQYGMSTGF
ncbi:MAG: hypothetical protein ACTSR8_21435 [Promethearchaeota archaeon]